jgi:hypothetical protein
MKCHGHEIITSRIASYGKTNNKKISINIVLPYKKHECG